MSRRFEAWIRELDEDVIQGEYGYESGEFTIYPDHWKAMFNGGLTPTEAWLHALAGFARAREEEEAAKKANWERIQREDAKYRTASIPS